MHLRLDDKLSNNFKKVFSWILQCKHSMYVLQGGRNSGKSVAVGMAIVLGVMQSRKSAIVLMQYQSDLKSKVVSNFTYCIKRLGVERHWKLKLSPCEYVLLDKNGKETDISIKFYGCDNIQDTKGFKSRTGEGFKYIWFEEVNRFKNFDVVQSIIDTCDRLAGERTCAILTYNPPKDSGAWVNELFHVPIGKQLGYETNLAMKSFEYEKAGVKKVRDTVFHYSTIEDLIEDGHADWISDGIYGSAMQAKENNPVFYRWNYLGDVCGAEADVFKNVHTWSYSIEDLMKIKGHTIHNGIDASNGGKDPWRYVEVAYDKRNNDLYILKEFNVSGIGDNVDATFDKVADTFKKYNKNNVLTYGDGAVPNNIKSLRNRGCNVVIVKKDVVVRGVMWLQGLNHIYIDPKVTPLTYQEFVTYAYKLDKEGNVTNDLQDGNDHSIDAVRYALVNNIKYDW